MQRQQFQDREPTELTGDSFGRATAAVVLGGQGLNPQKLLSFDEESKAGQTKPSAENYQLGSDFEREEDSAQKLAMLDGPGSEDASLKELNRLLRQQLNEVRQENESLRQAMAEQQSHETS